MHGCYPAANGETQPVSTVMPMTGIGGNFPVLLRDFARECVRHEDYVLPAHTGGLVALQPFETHRLTVVDLACKDESASFYSGDHHERQNVEVKFGDFVDYYSASSGAETHWLGEVEGLHFYLCQCPIAVYKPDETCASPLLPDIMKIFRIPDALSTMHVSQVNLWMAVKASRTGIHYDSYRNVLVVLEGQKTVKLYPPSETRNLYPRSIYSRSANHSSVDFVNPDLSVHPNFANTTPIVMTVQAGSAVYIPEGWWHQVDSAPHTIAVNYWFDGLRDQLVRDPEMSIYYARVIMEDIVRAETARAIQQLHCVMGMESENYSASYIASEAMSNEARESMLMSMSPEDLRRVLIELATTFPTVWRDLLLGSSDDFAAFLTDFWDHQEDGGDWIVSLFVALGEDADQVKHDLLTKHERFQQRIFTQALLATFGN